MKKDRRIEILYLLNENKYIYVEKDKLFLLELINQLHIQNKIEGTLQNNVCNLINSSKHKYTITLSGIKFLLDNENYILSIKELKYNKLWYLLFTVIGTLIGAYAGTYVGLKFK